MKRSIKWFADCILQLGLEKVIAFSIAAFVGIIVAIFLFKSIDTIPATSTDYAQLEEQMNVIKKNPDFVPDEDSNIILEVVVENDECKITKKYDANFEELETWKEDKAESKSNILMLVICAGIGLFYCIGWLLIFSISLIKKIVKWIFKKLNK